jgi:hypothetical protein
LQASQAGKQTHSPPISRRASRTYFKPPNGKIVWPIYLGQFTNVLNSPDADGQLRTAAYEVLNSFVTNAANDSLPMVASLSGVVLDRLEKTIPMQQQVVSVEDKLQLEEMQTSLVSVILAIIGRLEAEVKPQADRIMQICLQLLNTVGPKSSVPDTVFAAIGALANGLETDFLPYMEAFAPYLFKGLENQDEPSLCSMAIGLVSDVSRAIGEKIQPWCDDFMNRLLSDLQSSVLGNQFKPAILQCFGDIAQAIGGHFETYLAVVAQVLQQASTVATTLNDSLDLLDYIVSLREGIMDAWDGCIVAMKAGHKSMLARVIGVHRTDICQANYFAHTSSTSSSSFTRSSPTRTERNHCFAHQWASSGKSSFMPTLLAFRWDPMRLEDPDEPGLGFQHLMPSQRTSSVLLGFIEVKNPEVLGLGFQHLMQSH